MTRLIFLDTETTGLDPARHEPWEIGLIVRQPDADDRELLWQLWPNLATADPNGLRIGRFYERIRIGPIPGAARLIVDSDDPDVTPGRTQPLTAAADVANRLTKLLDSAHVVGAVPNFDENMLRPWLARNGQCWTAHYHLIDVEALAVGYLARRLDGPRPPWDSDVLSAALGVTAPVEERHTALGDARWARAIYDQIMDGTPR